MSRLFKQAITLLSLLATAFDVQSDTGNLGVASEYNRSNAVPNQLIVRFRDQTRNIEKQALFTQAQVVDFKWLDSQYPSSLTSNRIAPQQLQANQPDQGGEQTEPRLALITLPKSSIQSEALRDFRNHPDVLYAEPNYRLRLFERSSGPRSFGSLTPTLIPDDYEFSRQWSLQNKASGTEISPPDIDVTEAWKRSTGNKSIIVAVIDTGIDFFHPDLESNMWVNPKEIGGNGIDDDGNQYVDDVHGYDFVSKDGDPFDDSNHGTHVAGIIGAVGNNRSGIAGIAWQVSLMALKAFNEVGNSDVAHVIEAINYAIQNKARIINASWGGTERSSALQEIVQKAHRHGILFVAAAGNDHVDTAPVPASYPVTLAVGATDTADARAFFSNFGKWVDIAAPGSEIYSTYPDSNYEHSSGTSMAAPHVSGVAALLFSLHPDFSNIDIANILLNTTDPIKPDHPLGVGRLNAAKALAVSDKLPNLNLELPDIWEGFVDIKGTADGSTFRSFDVSLGDVGASPDSQIAWTVVNQSSQPVSNGFLVYGLDTSRFPEGLRAVRLRGVGTSGQTASVVKEVEIKNIRITYPLHNDILRAGDTIEIRGNSFGAGLEYKMSYGFGWSPNQWYSDGIQMVSSGSEERLNEVIATWDTSKVPSNRYYTLRLVATRLGKFVMERQTPMLYLDAQLRSGWPVRFPISEDFPPEDWRQLAVEDLEGDGVKEVILVDHGNSDGRSAVLKVLNLDGSQRWFRVVGRGQPYSDVPVVGDVDGDGKPEIFVEAGDANTIHAFTGDGKLFGNGWPVRLDAGDLGKVMADLDQDGKKEIITLSMNTLGWFGSGYRQLSVINSQGQILNQWNIPACDFEGDAPELLPAVGNLDQDSQLEIVCPYGCGGVALFELSKKDGPVWNSFLDATFRSAPVVGDINGDKNEEIIIVSQDTASQNRGGVYVLDGAGRRWSDFPVLLEESFVNSPALADLDNDGSLEICVASSNPRRIHVITHRGYELQGWPVGDGINGVLRSGPTIGDIDGDKHLDIIVPVLSSMRQLVSFGDLTRAGGIMAWNRHGVQIPFAGAGSNQVTMLPMESAGGGTRLKAAPATLSDLDGDGKLDVLAMSIQEAAYDLGDAPVVRKQRSSLYNWSLETSFEPELFPWPTWQRDNARSGRQPTQPRINRPPKILPIPNQIARTGSQFFPIRLDRYVQDPDQPASQLKWSVIPHSALLAEISPARVLTMSSIDLTWSGRADVTLVVSDTGGLSDQRTITLEMHPDFVPPQVIEDVFELVEDSSIDMAILANDKGADGGIMKLLEFSRAENGKITTLANGVLRYAPNPDFTGSDSITYSAIDSRGGIAQANVAIRITPVPDAPMAAEDRIIGLEDSHSIFNVLENDLDVDGDLFTLISTSKPEHGGLLAVSHGVYRYSPPTNFFGLDRFGYTIRDSTGLESDGQVQIIVRPVVDLPAAKEMTFSVNKNKRKEITYAADNPDGDKLKYKIVDAPKNGDLWTYPDVATYFPKSGFTGKDGFTYRANNGFEDGPIASITFHVTNTNNPPELEPLQISTKPGRILTLPIKVLDPDNDPIQLKLITPPSHGTTLGLGTNWSYAALPSFIGETSFEISATDLVSESAPVTVRVKITDQNTPPKAFDTKMDVILNTSTNLIFSVKDDESDPLSIELTAPPEFGTLNGSSPEFQYTPAPGFVGYDRVRFKVSDGEAISEPATLTLFVRPANQPPTTTNQTFTVLTGRVLDGNLKVIDPDGDKLRSPILKGPRNGRLVIRGTNFVYTPNTGYVGGDTFTYRSWDGYKYSPIAIVTLSVEPPSPPPKPTFGPMEIASNGQVVLTAHSVVGSICRLDYSEDLYDWIPLSLFRFTEKTIRWQDPTTGENKQRFYRLLLESYPQD